MLEVLLDILYFSEACFFLYLFANVKYLTNLSVFFLTIFFILYFVDSDSFEFILVEIFSIFFVIYHSIKVYKIKNS